MAGHKFQKGNKYAVGGPGGGRKTLYKPEYADIGRKLCLLGKIDVELAEIFGVDESTIYTWKKDFPEFAQALRDGKQFADANVAEALYHRACGYKHKAQKIMQNNGVPVIVDYTERYPPDTAAAIIWLKNRQRKHWNDRPTADDENEVTPDKVSVDVVDAGVPDADT